MPGVCGEEEAVASQESGAPWGSAFAGPHGLILLHT